MSSPRRIYLDNAATSWPKPESVYRAVERIQRDVGAAAGRGAYAEALEAGRLVESARAGLSRLIGAGDPRRIVFTNNGTDSLNLAIHGFLEPGDHVVTTAAEHNSVLRPLRELENRGVVQVTRVACDAAGQVDPHDIQRAITAKTKLVAILHASNVTGAIQPVPEIGKIARNLGAAFLVDAAQTLGHLPISVDEMLVDMLAAPGHKGLLGPLGTGLLYVRQGIESRLRSVRQGGTGTRSEEDCQPQSMPDKYESGNPNVPGLAGLAAGVEFVEARGLLAIRRHEVALTERFLERLRTALKSRSSARRSSPNAWALSACESRAMIRKRLRQCSTPATGFKCVQGCTVPRSSIERSARLQEAARCDSASAPPTRSKRSISRRRPSSNLQPPRRVNLTKQLTVDDRYERHAMVQGRPAVQVHPMRRLLHRGAWLCLGEQSRDRSIGRQGWPRNGRIRAKIRSGRGGPEKPDRVPERRLRLLRRPNTKVPGLRRQTQAMPDLAVLGVEYQDRRGMAADMCCLPW